MSGYLLKSLLHTRITNPAANATLLTVPASHVYMLKNCSAIIERTGAGAVSFYLEISDSAGANFKQMTDLYTTPAAASKTIINLSPKTPAMQNAGTLVTTAAAATQYTTLENKVLEAGQLIRFNINGAGWGGAAFIDFNFSGADYTV